MEINCKITTSSSFAVEINIERTDKFWKYFWFCFLLLLSVCMFGAIFIYIIWNLNELQLIISTPTVTTTIPTATTAIPPATTAIPSTTTSTTIETGDEIWNPIRIN